MLGRTRKLLLGVAFSAALLGPAAWSVGPSSSEAETPSAHPPGAAVTVVVGPSEPSSMYAVDPGYDERMREEAEARARAEEERARAAEAARYAGIFPSVEHWLRIHQCEQADSWTVHGRFGNGLMGGGGLGISDGAWADWGGLQYAPTAGGADPLDQMRVASVGYARYGASPWGCR